MRGNTSLNPNPNRTASKSKSDTKSKPKSTSKPTSKLKAKSNVNSSTKSSVDNTWVSMVIQQSKAKSNPTWSCPKCTLENQLSAQKCSACDHPKTQKAQKTQKTQKTQKNGSKKGKKKKSKNSSKTTCEELNGHSAEQWECQCSTINEGILEYCHVCTLPRDPNAAFYYEADDLKYESVGMDYANKVRANPKQEDEHPVDDTEDNDQNGWSTAGNKKCDCGSGRKYKKCCKKLEKHKKILVVNNGKNGYRNGARNGTRNGLHNGFHNGMNHKSNGESSALQTVEDAIQHLELEVEHFRGRKQDRMKLVRELEKAKNMREKLRKKAEQERRNGKENKGNGNGRRNKGSESNGGNERDGNVNANSAANQVIAI